MDVSVRFQELLERFEDDDIQVRERTQHDILGLGASVAPLLYDLAAHRSAEVRGRCRDTLERLLIADPETRARWGGISPTWERDIQVQATGFAILCFLGSGYTQLSKTEFLDDRVVYGKFCTGTIVKKALQWLLRQQKDDGSFVTDNIAANAMAVLALSEAYGMTCSQALKESAERAVEFLCSVASKETAGHAWKAMALMSASDSSLPCTRASYVEHAPLLAADAAPLALAATIIYQRFMKQADPDLLTRFADLDPKTLGPEELSLATLAAWRIWNPSTPSWKEWSQKVQARALSSQVMDKSCERGSWISSPGGYGAELLSTMSMINTMQRTYGLSNVFLQSH